jgi:hypothetical protein
MLSFYQPLLDSITLYPGEFDEIRQTYFRRILSDSHPIKMYETMLRAFLAVFRTWDTHVGLKTAQSALSILFVIILRVNDPQDWPQIYWRLRDAVCAASGDASGIVSWYCGTATTASKSTVSRAFTSRLHTVVREPGRPSVASTPCRSYPSHPLFDRSKIIDTRVPQSRI